MTHTIPFFDDPVYLLEIFKDEPHLFFLDSSLSNNEHGRYCYLGFSPVRTIQTKDFVQLRKSLKPYMGRPHSLPFAAGALGSISYDGQMWFGIYETIICVDQEKKTLVVSVQNLISNQKARQRIKYILEKLNQPHPLNIPHEEKVRKLVLKSNTTRGQYITAVKKALKHIYDGDIYQINLSQRFEVAIHHWPKETHPTDIYRQLRKLSPSAFSAYLDEGKTIIISSSPERFLKLMNGLAQVRPMKGTRPRGQTSKQDQAYKRELLNSAKEKAELLMVTDLERNDLGRVCQWGSVKVKDMRTIEEYKTVFQATSTVEGLLRKDKDLFDLLESTFPSGSVTGCPKIEARKIIKKLERSKRQLYTGALGYISTSGNMDFNVLIRTLFLEKNKISFYVGGGIVADSDPEKEYEETLLKAQAMVKALELSLKGKI